MIASTRWRPGARFFFVPGAFLLAVLILGISIYRDFGVHWDEFHNQYFGRHWGQYVERTLGLTWEDSIHVPGDVLADGFDFREHNATHGPFFELLLYFSERGVLPPHADFRHIIFFRHLLVFLSWYLGSVMMYFLCKRIFGNSSFWGLLGSLIYVLHPRIFADAFYNSVDTPFMVFYLASTLTLLRFLERREVKSAALHGFILGLLVDIRATGLLMVVLTYGALGTRAAFHWKDRVASWRTWLTPVAALSVVLAATVFLFWPLLWTDPIGHLTSALRESTGRRLGPPAAPLYNFFWIAVTTPVTYLVFALVGLFVAALSRRGEVLLVLLTFIVPTALTWLARPYLFDSWRHHYFLWPSMVILCLSGLQGLVTGASTFKRQLFRRITKIALWGALAASLATTTVFMVRMHPFQYVFTSILAGENGRLALAGGSCLDYWGVSTFEGLRYIVAHDPSENIGVFMAPIRVGFYLLPPEDRRRIVITDHPDEAGYAVTFYRPSSGPRLSSLPDPPIYSLSSKGTRFLGVYRLGDPAPR
jgi:hypothetical protein